MAEMNAFEKTTTEAEEYSKHSSNNSDSRKKEDPVSIFCRIKQVKEDKGPPCINLTSSTTLSLVTPIEHKVQRKDIQYTYTDIFTPRSTQKEVFEESTYRLLEDLMKGKNALLFVHGVHKSGKSFTLTGNQHDSGVIPRCINLIFNTINEHQAVKFLIKSDKLNGFELQTEKDAEQARRLESKTSIKTVRSVRMLNDHHDYHKPLSTNDSLMIPDCNESNLFAVFVSYIEVYNNIVYDLLDEASGKVLQVKIVREDANKNMYVNNVLETEVKSPVEALQLLVKGQKRRIFGCTKGDSNRSHLIFNIRLVQYPKFQNNDNAPKSSQLSIVDLAGPEKCAGKRLKEIGSIKNSLMSLRICMEILRDNQLNNANRLIPYRDSKLTLLFKNYFEGNGRVHMIICVNPTVQHYDENLQVMKFADVLRDVKIDECQVKRTAYVKPVLAKKKIKIPSSQMILVGPKLTSPTLSLTDPEATNVAIVNFSNILKMRVENLHSTTEQLNSKGINFRKYLIDVKQQNLENHHAIIVTKQTIKENRRTRRRYEKQIINLETVQSDLNSQVNDLQNSVKNLKRTVDEKDEKINQNIIKRERNKQKIACELEKSQQELQQHLNRQRKELDTQMRVKQIKLQKIKEVLEEKDVPANTRLMVENDKTDIVHNLIDCTSDIITSSIVHPSPSRLATFFDKNSSANVASQTQFLPTGSGDDNQ